MLRMSGKPIIALLQFCTVLPLGKPVEFGNFAQHTWLYPLAGYITGGFAALVSFWIPNPAIAAVFAIAGLFLITGCNHLDGLLDFGDGLMAHGNREKRIIALTDRQVGTGAIALAISVFMLTWTGLSAVYPLVWTLLIAEVCAKFSMAFLTVTGKPFRDGIHSYLHSQSRPVFLVYAALLCLPLALLPVPPFRLAVAAVLMVVIPVMILLMSVRLFGGVNGDVVGAAHELTRAFIIVACAFV
jgi:adenosylcobinamide-GDP ribazoletransferase